MDMVRFLVGAAAFAVLLVGYVIYYRASQREVEDYESDGEQRTRIRHEGGL